MSRITWTERGERTIIPWLIASAGAAISILLRWYFVTHAQVLQPLDNPLVRADAAEYYRLAWNMLHHSVFATDIPSSVIPEPSSFRDPGYPALLCAWLWVTSNYGSWYAAVLITHAIMGGITVACISLSLRDALPTWLLLSATLAMAIWPHSVAITAYVLSENLTAVLCAAAIFALKQATDHQSPGLSALAGLLIAAAGLTNAVLAPIIFPLIVVLRWKGHLPWRHIGLMAACVLVPQCLWQLRNASLPSTSSSMLRAEMNLVQGSWPTYHDAAQLAARSEPAGLQTMDAIDSEVSAFRSGLRPGIRALSSRISRAPGVYVSWYTSKPALLWSWDIRVGQGDIYVYPTRHSPYLTNPLLRVSESAAFIINPVLALMALVGCIVVLALRNPPIAVTAMATLLLWVTAVYGVLQSEPRYSIPYRGEELAMASFAIASAAALLRQLRQPEKLEEQRS